MKCFWGIGNNVGDTLTPVILEYFTKHKAEWVPSTASNKLLMCGSILEFAKPGDTVLGAGHYKKEPVDLTDVLVLALRGPNSGVAPSYGDPAILLPLMYSPTVAKTKKVGYIPHVWQEKTYEQEHISVNLPWKQFVDEILKCELIQSTSLHGIIIAQAYGIPAYWRHDPEIPGSKIKYEDYLAGLEMELGLQGAQQSLIDVLERL